MCRCFEGTIKLNTERNKFKPPQRKNFGDNKMARSKKLLAIAALGASLSAVAVGNLLDKANYTRRYEEAAAKAHTARMIAELKESGAKKSAGELKDKLSAVGSDTINRLGAARNFEERIQRKIRTNVNARFTPTELMQAGYALGSLHAAHDYFSNTGAPTIANNMTERYDALMTSTNRGVLSYNALRKVQHPGTVRRSGTRHH